MRDVLFDPRPVMETILNEAATLEEYLQGFQNLEVYKNEEPSIYDNEDMKVVADRLPAAIYYMVFGPDYIYGIETLAGGVCVQNQHPNDEVLDVLGWLKFDSAASAEATMENIEDDLSRELNITITDARLSGQFIEITGEMEIP